ncbi:malonyl-ACP O-methyltransferase BioC [Paenibacillus albicereus]|uniref:Malonyl-[acyl-carrier protein] O-methyltransferase n=1 Tax=Paenibacillus albicereus TaxID=2726185 RepID=A0A6H2H0G4_9BACL|nr:malonyl-ACP O-methyltransferase BioC [Paenibacillus albicereus]QJC53089.1 malonyl-ACP O-methyltransferase BioC [Paenibacillus albicereus]
MESSMESIGRRFDRNAARYDAHADVQRRMAARLAAALRGWRNVPQQAHAVEIGCGTGALTARLAEGWPEARLTALDAAPAMLRLARQRCGLAERVCFIQADAETWAAEAPSASCDVIVSNACFQWLRDPEATLRHLRRLLRPGGGLAFATFGPDTFFELHESFRTAYLARGLEPQRHGLSFREADGWKAMLEQAGFADVRMKRSMYRETYPSARAFLHSVQATGASATQARPAAGGMRSLFADMFEVYESRFAVEGGVAASYDVVTVEAFAEPRGRLRVPSADDPLS